MFQRNKLSLAYENVVNVVTELTVVCFCRSNCPDRSGIFKLKSFKENHLNQTVKSDQIKPLYPYVNWGKAAERNIYFQGTSGVRYPGFLIE